jgi:hypothetical protein
MFGFLIHLLLQTSNHHVVHILKQYWILAWMWERSLVWSHSIHISKIEGWQHGKLVSSMNSSPRMWFKEANIGRSSLGTKRFSKGWYTCILTFLVQPTPSFKKKPKVKVECHVNLFFCLTFNVENRSQRIKIQEIMILDPFLLESYFYHSNILLPFFVKNISKSKTIFTNPTHFCKTHFYVHWFLCPLLVPIIAERPWIFLGFTMELSSYEFLFHILDLKYLQ